MTEVPNDPVEDFVSTQASIVDVIKQKQQELEAAKEVYIPIKGYEAAGLVARYHMPESGKIIDTIIRKNALETKDEYYRNFNSACDIMINLCDGLYIKHPENEDDYVMLDPAQNGVPVGFDSDLAELLGLDIKDNPTARAVIKKLFGGKELNVLNHSEKLQRWINDTSTDVNSELWSLDGNF